MWKVYEYLALVFASALWSLNPAIISRFRDSLNPITFIALRASIAFPLIAIISYMCGGAVIKWDQQVALILATSAVLGPGVGDICYTKSIQLIGGSLAVIISYTYIFVSQLLASALLNESLSTSSLIASLMAFTGIVIALGISYSGRGSLVKGVLLSLAASITWSVALTFLKIALNYVDIPTAMLVRLALVIALFLPLGLVSEGLPKLNALKYLAFAAAFTSISDLVVGMYLFMYSLRRLGLSASVIPTALTPVLTLVTTKAIAREALTPNYVVGAVLVSIAILITALNTTT